MNWCCLLKILHLLFSSSQDVISALFDDKKTTTQYAMKETAFTFCTNRLTLLGFVLIIIFGEWVTLFPIRHFSLMSHLCLSFHHYCTLLYLLKMNAQRVFSFDAIGHTILFLCFFSQFLRGRRTSARVGTLHQYLQACPNIQPQYLWKWEPSAVPLCLTKLLIQWIGADLTWQT